MATETTIALPSSSSCRKRRGASAAPANLSRTRRTASAALSCTWRMYAAHHGEAELPDHAPELGHAAGVGRHLGAQVGEVLLQVAHRVGGAREQLRHLALSQPAVLDQQEVLDQDALVVDGAAPRRHGAGRHPADVGVVGARRDEEERGCGCGRRRPRVAAPRPSGNTGVTTVRSGRWVPPA